MTRSQQLPMLQIYRGIAAVMVVLYHVTVYGREKLGFTFLQGLFSFGYTGVDFFFVLSGFIIFYVHGRDIGRPERAVSYLARRLARVYPIYWVVTSIKVALVLGIPSFGQAYERLPGVVVKSYLLIPQTNLPVIGAAWTLSYEMLFYVTFGLCILSGRKWGLSLFCVWMGTVIAHALFGGALPGALQTFAAAFILNERNLEFALGVLSAYLVLQRRVPAPRLMIVGGVALFALSAWSVNQGHQVSSYTLSFGLASFLLITGSALLDSQQHLVSPRPLVFIGNASYSIYLTHAMFINAVMLLVSRVGRLNSMNPLLLVPVIVVSAIGASCLLYQVVERPLVAYLGARLRRLPTASKAQVLAPRQAEG